MRPNETPEPEETKVETPRLEIEVYGKSVEHKKVPRDKRAPKNLDRVFVDQKDGVIAVFDGISADADSDIASQAGVDVLSNQNNRAILQQTKKQDVEDAMRTIFAMIIDQIHSQARALNVSRLIGTTGVIAKQWDMPSGIINCVTIGYIGDSRAYIKRRNGDFRCLTIDQTVLNQTILDVVPDAAERMFEFQKKIDEAQTPVQLRIFLNSIGFAHDEISCLFRDGSANVLTGYMSNDNRLLTADSVESTALLTIEVFPGDKLYLVSDGVNKPLFYSELEKLVSSDMPLAEECDSIVSQARHFGVIRRLRCLPDDISITAMSFHSSH